MDRGFWRQITLNRENKHYASACCKSVEEFKMVDSSQDGCPLVFEYDNRAWEVSFPRVGVEKNKTNCYYNGKLVQEQEAITIKDGDSLRVKYRQDLHAKKNKYSADVILHYDENTLSWNLEKAIQEKEEKLESEITSLKQNIEEMNDKLKSAAEANEKHLEEIGKHKEVKKELRKQIAELTQQLKIKKKKDLERSAMAMLNHSLQQLELEGCEDD